MVARGPRANRATRSLRPGELPQHWWVLDAENQVLGRLATRVASVLRGKHRPLFTPHADPGDYVIVVNAEKVKLTGDKRSQKTYHWHTGYMGHLKSETAEEVLSSRHADRVVRRAVTGMLPKNTLGRRLGRKLKVYVGPDHPHAAQKPEELTLG